MQPLLKPEEVAELLQLSLSTIYAKAQNLGGFYPVGIKALRFRRETIYAIMAGPQNRKIPHSIPATLVDKLGVDQPKKVIPTPRR